MGTITLDDRDRAILERLREGDAGVETLARSVDADPATLRARLPELGDNGLVRPVDGGYALTANGERALQGSPAGARDDRIDTPPEVERRIESFDLRPDRADAVRAAFAFLRYWGEASDAEIVDGVYSEHPAAFESSREWWTDCVHDRLADLPSVESPESADQWRYAETPGVEEHTEDGRIAPDDHPPAESSAKFALEGLDLDDDARAAVGAAFERLVHEREVRSTDLAETVYPDHDAGYDSASAWWSDCVAPAFEQLPGVERADGDRWAHTQTAEGPMSSAPGAEVPEELVEPRADEERSAENDAEAGTEDGSEE